MEEVEIVLANLIGGNMLTPMNMTKTKFLCKEMKSCCLNPDYRTQNTVVLTACR